MKTAAKVVLDQFGHSGKRRRMSRMLDRVENGGAVAVGQVQLARSTGCNVVRNNFANFVAEGLNRNYAKVSNSLHRDGRMKSTHILAISGQRRRSHLR